MTDSHDYPRTQPDGEHLVYETPWWDFYYDDTIRSNGSPGKYAWAKIHSGNGGAMVVPVTPSGRCLMIKLFRYPAKRYMWEFPAGMIEDGETPEEGGQRELLEETGYASETWSDLGPIYQNPASHTNLCHLWLADDATPTGATSPGAGEHIQALVMSEAEVVVAVRDGRIAHPLTLAALSRVLDLRV